MKPARSLSLLGILSAAALLVASCGGSSISSERTEVTDDSTSDTAEPGATTVAGTSDIDEVSVPSECQDRQKADGGQYEVKNIPANDPDGGLVARSEPGSTSSQVGENALPEGTIVDSSTDPSDCFVTSDGATWWNIGTPQLATGGWVNARFLVSTDGDLEPGEEPDAHADCVVLPDLPTECFPVFYVGNGITAIDFEMTSDTNGEFQFACVYQGLESACAVLAFIGPGDGIGNELSQAPDEAVKQDCDELSGVAKKLACAEFARR